ncbi:MAG TPA: YpdA family putative bacillithiol disulfide reductase [Vicinamibacterales bacterium]|nr:YpdA family putative bacillithiol disulfide reductase [Vicinamibacterales bacterium]
MHDVIVIGAGPVGLACAIEAGRHGLRALVIDKGALVNSIVGYPANMEFFSTPDLIEIGGYPFPVQGYKPTREEAIEYYRGVAAREQLEIRLYETVLDVTGTAGAFTVVTKRGQHAARRIIVAVGFFDRPNLLGVAGEELSKVTHYYREPYPYVRQEVAVIGAKNSAARAALDCHRHGARVTLIVRGGALSESVKYWIRPDLENRIKEGSIRALFNSAVEEIRPSSLLVRSPEGLQEIDNDWVLALTGYHPDFSLLERLGVTFAADEYRTPVFDETTFETARPGLYLAGTVCGGYRTNRWFIENGRFHAQQIARHIAGERTERIRFDAIHWKTEE